MIRRKPAPHLDSGVGTGFPRDKRENAFARRSCSNKEIERDDDSKKSHHAPVSRIRSSFESMRPRITTFGKRVLASAWS
jgi:hypothetical protein